MGLRGLVLAGLIAILMSSMSACYNASATLVVRDFVLRFKPATSERRQVVIGRWVTVLMAVLGVAAAPLVGLSVTIWYYLQFISAYLSVPMAAVILTGLLWKKGNTKGAIGGLIAGFSLGLVFFLDQVLHWELALFPIRSCTPSCTGPWWRLSPPCGDGDRQPDHQPGLGIQQSGR